MLSYWTVGLDSYFLFFLNLCDLWCFECLVGINSWLIINFSCFSNPFESCCILMHLINLLLMLIVRHLFRTWLVLVILDLFWGWLALVLLNSARILLALVVWYSLWARTFLWTWSEPSVAWIEKQLKVSLSSDAFFFILIVILLFKFLC